ncbi:MAG: twin-arginine translocase subunit TatC [Bacteroidota bacterium]|nr:twin-arginine translocase subunit TatC [Bacteroidota bacterium]
MKQEQLKKTSFLSHLEQLRWHLVYSFLAIILFTIISFINIKIIFDNFIFAFLNPKFPTYEFLCSISKSLCLNPLTLQFQNIDLAGQFNMSLLVAFSFGLIFSFPYILFEFWLFIKPGMYKSERKYARYLIFFSVVLFILGVLFGYYIITPLSLNFLSNFTVSDIIINDINFISFVKTITKFILLCGFVFQLPFVIYFLAKFNLVTKKLLQIYRKHAFVIVLILSSIITPPDVLSQILIAFPLMILYEISIIVVHYVHKKNET